MPQGKAETVRTVGDEANPGLLREQVMGLAGGNNSFELSGDIRDPIAVVMARIRRAREDPLGLQKGMRFLIPTLGQRIAFFLASSLDFFISTLR